MGLAEIRERAVDERVAWLTAIYELSDGSTNYVTTAEIDSVSQATNPKGARSSLVRAGWVEMQPWPRASISSASETRAQPSPRKWRLTAVGLERIEAHIDAFDEDAIAVMVFEQSVIEGARAMKLGDAKELADELESEPLTAERWSRLKEMGFKVGTAVATKLALARLGLE